MAVAMRRVSRGLTRKLSRAALMATLARKGVSREL